MEKIKIIIWDLDETFWRGTLSEGAVKAIPEHIEIVQSLVDKGIMNSIVSKNDFDKAKLQLEEFGVWDLFIFPKISWNPKGEIVKQLLEQCQLRPENALFVDDNESNLQEVKYYNPKINVINAVSFNKDFISQEAFKGKDDKQHSRLLQYKQLEKRKIEEVKYSSNIDFLKNSNIIVSIKDDCWDNKERILELIERTNQLNFTKKRISPEDLQQLLQDENTTCRYIDVSDKFGNYGIVGFYALQNGELIHFLFSCRILGLGVENYIYNKLNHPSINIVGEVACKLQPCNTVTWISEGDINERQNASEQPNKHSILMVGGCDLEQTNFYLSSDYNISTEFATKINGFEIRSSDTTQLVNALTLSESEKTELCTNLPFYHDSVTFSTQMYSGAYDVIIFSVVDDYVRGLYKHNHQNYHISFQSYFNIQAGRAIYGENNLKYLDDNFTFVGKESTDFFEKNLRFIIENIISVNKQTLILLINGNEVDVSEWIGSERCEQNIRMNAVVDNVVKDYNNVHLVDMRKLVGDKNDFSKKDNRHYNRTVYFRMANEITKILGDAFGISDVKTKSKLTVFLKLLFNKLTNFIQRWSQKITKEK